VHQLVDKQNFDNIKMLHGTDVTVIWSLLCCCSLKLAFRNLHGFPTVTLQKTIALLEELQLSLNPQCSVFLEKPPNKEMSHFYDTQMSNTGFKRTRH